MKPFIIATLLILSTFQLNAQTTLPDIQLKTMNGSTFNSGDISNDGKPVLVLVWELSCKPCLQEFDNVKKLYTQWQQELGVKVVAISVDDNRNYTKVPAQVRSKGWPFEFYQDKNQDIKRAMGIQYCPYAFIVNEKNEVIWRKGGYSQGDELVMYELLARVSKGEKVSDGN